MFLEELLQEGNPQSRGYRSSGWTVPLLKSELAKAGYVVSELHCAPDAKEIGLSLEASEIRARQTRSGPRE